MSTETLEHIEQLSEMRHIFRPTPFRSCLGEALVYFFSKETDSLTEILTATNKVLKTMEVEEVSMGFVRHALKR